MIKNISYLFLCIGLCTIISCEKDFSDFESEVIKNNKFKTIDTIFDVSVEQLNTNSLRTDNIELSKNTYLIGLYAPKNYKETRASIISKIDYISNFKTRKESNKDTVRTYTLKNADLTLVYQRKSNKKTPILRTPQGKLETTLKVYRNEWFLNGLNPEKPSKKNSFQSNHFDSYVYNEENNLTDQSKFSFTVNENDSLIKIPLDTEKIRTIFWNKFANDEFSSKNKFENYFRGIIIKPENNSGFIIPINIKLSSINIKYSLTEKFKVSKEKDTTVTKDKTYSFKLGNLALNQYDKTAFKALSSNNEFVIQGTAVSKAKINILIQDKIAEIRSKKWLINDASLTFYVDQKIDTDTALVPSKLVLYKNLKGDIPVFLSDNYVNSASFDGKLQYDKNYKPYKYKIGITNYINKVIKGETLSPLILKSYNRITDEPVVNNVLDSIVKPYNWNPRGVTLFNGDKENLKKRVVLKISYAKK